LYGEALASTDINQDPAGQTGPEAAMAVPKSDTTYLHENLQAGSSCHQGGKEEETSSKTPQRRTMRSPGCPPLPMPRWRSTLAALPTSHMREGTSQSPRSSLACSINPRIYL